MVGCVLNVFVPYFDWTSAQYSRNDWCSRYSGPTHPLHKSKQRHCDECVGSEEREDSRLVILVQEYSTRMHRFGLTLLYVIRQQEAFGFKVRFRIQPGGAESTSAS